MINVGPTVKKPTHVFSLSDGTTTLGFLTCDNSGIVDPQMGFSQSPMPRTAMKLAQGQATYEDFELPFTSIIQDDFSGGMLAEDFERDRSKYRDGRHCDTTRGDVICGPDEIISKGITYLGDLSFQTRVGAPYDAVASQYTPATTITVTRIRMRATYDRDHFDLNVAIYADSGGSPGSLLASGERTVYSEGVWEVELDTPQELTGSTQYWIGAWQSESGLTACYHDKTDTDIYRYQSSSWNTFTSDHELAYELVIAPINARFRFFEHRRCLYAIASWDDGSTNAKLYQNGYRGCASSNSSDKTKLNTDQDLSEDSNGDTLDLEGKIALIIDGPGSEEEQPWRTIISNTTTGTNDVITVDQPWNTTHTVDTSFVILGSDDWWEITGHGLGTEIRDVLPMKDYVAVAQGQDDYIRKIIWYNDSGSSTYAFKDDGTNTADYLLMVADTEGDMMLWAANVEDGTVDYAPAKGYSTDHTFEGKDIEIGTSRFDDIKGLVAYGDPLIPYVIKENSFGSIENDIYGEIPVGEMDEIRSETNGLAVMKHNVYLYFNIGEMIERFYDRRLDDVGLTAGEGLPENRRGIVRDMLAYPGRYYAAIYTEGNVPSIHCFNGIGWHEVWRPTSVTDDGSGDTGEDAPFAYNVDDLYDGRISDMIVQVIPGGTIDRLWFDHNGQLIYLPITVNPRQDVNYKYRDLSQLETAWIYGNLKDVDKYWHSIKMHTENLSGTDQSIKIEYKLDEDTSWTHIGVVETSPIQELDLSDTYDVTGYRIKFRFTLHTSDSSETPRIMAYVVKGVIRVDAKKGWNVMVVTKNNLDLNGDVDEQVNIMPQLDIWSNSDQTAAPLQLRHNIGYYDSKYVFIDPASVNLQQVELQPTKGNEERRYTEIATFAMYEV